jgi:hypothetical protein
MMKPILFSAPMVQAILEGRKTQTRRAMRTSDGLNKPISGDFEFKGIKEMVDLDGCGTWERGPFAVLWHKKAHDDLVVKCPYEVGDLLWVRETWTENCGMLKNALSGKKRHYCADCKPDATGLFAPCKWKKKPSVIMPRAAARIFLRVTKVGVERLQEIKTEDCAAEGAVMNPHYMRYGGERCLALHRRYKTEFAQLWDSLNAKRGFGWETNPWVWVYTFDPNCSGMKTVLVK